MSSIPRVPSRRLAAALTLTIGLVAAGCGSQAKVTGTVVKDAQGCATEVDHRPEAPVVAAGTVVGKKVASKDLITGKGCSPTGAEYLSLDLVGATAADGKDFISTWETKRPVTAQLGKGTLLPALEGALSDVKVGDRRQITIPAADAYGAAGNPGQGIGPNQDLVFVLDLLSLTPKPRFCAAANGVPSEVGGKPIKNKPAIENPVNIPIGDVVTRDRVVGTGATVTKTSYVTVNYVGISCSTGKQFDSSWDRGEPASFALNGGVIVGWSDGLAGAKAGGIRELDVPAQLGYGASGNPQGGIAPNDALTFVIQILKVEKKAPATPTTTAPAGSATPTTTAPAGSASTTTGAPAPKATTTSPAASSTTADKSTTTTGG
jgi:peptidylprolyl isomerase